MRKICTYILLTLIMASCGVSPLEVKNETIKKEGSDVIDFKVLPFRLDKVKLLNGPYKHATDLGLKTLMNLEPNRLLAKFRIEAGLEPKAENYGGWESGTLAGHSTGHYMVALTYAYMTTGDEEYLDRANYIIDQLAECQDHNGSGYIGAFTDGERVFKSEVAKGEIRAQGFDLNGLWAPFYTMHKLLDGLHHIYEYTGNQKALEIEKRFADWIYTIVDDLTEEKMQEMLHCEFGGMNDVLAELYGTTNDEKYLNMARKFHHNVIVDPITEGKNILPGKHCNTLIPKFIGSARLYELTGNQNDYKAATNFWRIITDHHMYAPGDFDNYEYLQEPDKLNDQLSNSTAETCCVYNMLKLSRHLFEWSADAKMMDYYEKALINHILSAQHPKSGEVIYNLSLEMGGFKVYQHPYHFTCCVGSGMETNVKYGGNIYFHNNSSLYVALFIASELTWKEKGVKLTQNTGFPNEEGTTLKVEALNGESVDFDLVLRYPAWAKNGMTVTVNGKKRKFKGKPGSFVNLGTCWKDGDVVKVSFPFSLFQETMPDNKNRIAIFNGPVVLAAQLGEVEDADVDNPLFVPILMTQDTVPTNWMKPVPGDPNSFTTKGVGHPNEITFKPFYNTHDLRYSVYIDKYTPEEWKVQEAEYLAEQERKKEIERKTIDLFRLGEMQPERDHNYDDGDDKSWVGEYKSIKYREIDRGGYATFTMTAKPGKKNALVFTYWGGYSGGKTFDILVEGKKVATENITHKAPGKFIDVQYDIPVELTKDKSLMKIKIAPHEGNRGGPIFIVRSIDIEL